MKPVVIIGQTRGGSSYVQNLIENFFGLSRKNGLPPNSLKEPWAFHGEKHSDEEIKNEYKKLISFIEQGIKKYPTFIIKDHIQHYSRYKDIFGEEFPFDEIYRDFYRIKITRTSLLEMSFSLAIAIASERYNVFFQKDTRSFFINKILFLNCMERIIEFDNQRKKWESKSILYDDSIRYEELTGNPEIDRLKFKLTADPTISGGPLTVQIIKRNDYHIVVKNWQELEELYHEKIFYYTEKYSKK
jgi:hypothetical protein